MRIRLGAIVIVWLAFCGGLFTHEAAGQGVIIGCGDLYTPDCSRRLTADEIAQKRDANRKASQADNAQARLRQAAIDAEVARLGAHRRVEIERAVDLKLAAERARGGKSVAPYVAPPPLPRTSPPKGFVDMDGFVTVSNPAEARALFAQVYGRGGKDKLSYLHEACYANGMGGYHCQARLRFPSKAGPSAVQR